MNLAFSSIKLSLKTKMNLGYNISIFDTQIQYMFRQNFYIKNNCKLASTRNEEGKHLLSKFIFRK